MDNWFQRSGLVQFHLPHEGGPNAPLMPSGGRWIAAVSPTPLANAGPALIGLQLNGAVVTAQQAASDSAQEAGADTAPIGPNASPAIWSSLDTRPGLGKIQTVESLQRALPRETRADFLARSGERLRHHGGLVTPWDAERLVLSKFPEVWLTTCLANCHPTRPGPQPGHQTLVVARRASQVRAANGTQIDPASWQAPQFDAIDLEEIRAYVAARLASDVQLHVINASYDRLYVRAWLTLADPSRLQTINMDLRDHLSVWHAPRRLQRFGWSLSLGSVRAFLDSHAHVQGVHGVSLFQLGALGGQTYDLEDTARAEASENTAERNQILRPSRPWALPLSAPEHPLGLADPSPFHRAQPSGVGLLEVGQNLVVA